MKRGFLYVEICIHENWVLPDPLLKNPNFHHPKYHKEGEPEFKPQSRYLPADQPVVDALLNAAGERGLPHDISPELQEYYSQSWKEKKPFGKSWMTLEEIIAYEESEPDDEHFYLDSEWFIKHGEPDQVRAVFWFAEIEKK